MSLICRTIAWVYTERDTLGKPVADVKAGWEVAQSAGSGDPGFRVTGTRLRDGSFQITWPAKAGQAYQIVASGIVTGGYQTVKTVAAESDGLRSETFRPGGDAMFFRVMHP